MSYIVSDTLSEKVFWTSRRILAAILNLAIIPGSGSFLVGRYLDGTIQLILSVSGTVLALGAMIVTHQWAGQVLGHPMGFVVDPQTAQELKEAYLSSEVGPRFLGLDVFVGMAMGFLLMTLGWIYSIISIFHKPPANPPVFPPPPAPQV